jgi:hypothetical protein
MSHWCRHHWKAKNGKAINLNTTQNKMAGWFNKKSIEITHWSATHTRICNRMNHLPLYTTPQLWRESLLCFLLLRNGRKNINIIYTSLSRQHLRVSGYVKIYMYHHDEQYYKSKDTLGSCTCSLNLHQRCERN